MENNTTEKVIPKEDHTNKDKQTATVPAPIPEKSAWKVSIEVTEKVSEVITGKSKGIYTYNLSIFY